MAQSVVGALRVNLGLDSAQFQNGLGRAQGALGRFSQRAKLALAAAAAAAVAAVTALTKRSMTFVDQQAKVARTIDGSIDGLRALQLAAGDAGVAQSDLNKSMQMIGARLVEAQVKGGATADALKRLGLNAAELSRMDADERLATMADRVKELGLSSGQATQFLMDMGVRSKEMALLLTGGGDAIRAARQEIQDLGLSMSAVDAAKVEAANDAMSRIGVGIEALGQRLAVTFAPMLERMAEGFTASMREGGALRLVLDGLGVVIERVASYAVTFGAYMGARYVAALGMAAVSTGGLSAALTVLRGALIRTGLGALIVLAGELAFRLSKLIERVGGFGNAMSLMGAVAAEVWQRVGDGADYVRSAVVVMASGMTAAFYGGLRKMAGAWVSFTQSIASGINALFGTSLSGASAVITQELGLAQLAAEDAGAAAADAMSKAGSSFTKPLASIRALKDAISDTTEAAETDLQDATDAAENFNEALDKTGGGGGSASRAKEGVEKLSEAAKRLKERMQETKNAFGTAFRSIVTGAQSAGEAVGQLLQRFAEMLADRAFNSLWDIAANALTGGGTGGGFWSSIFGGDTGRAVAPVADRITALDTNSKPFDVARAAAVDYRAGPAAIPAEVRVIGGDLTLTDNGEIRATMQVMANDAVNRAVSAVDARMRRTKSFGQPA
jgi:hypothetical protein